MSDVIDTRAERGTRDGTGSGNAGIAQAVNMELQDASNWTRMAPDQREALEVICQKISRIVTGDPDYIDNWHDIQGYAKLVEDRLHGKA